MKISTFTFKGQDIDMTYQNGFLAYSFKQGEETYGTKVRPLSRSVLDSASATFQLLINAIETMESLNENKRLRESTTENQPKADNSTKSK